LDDQPQTETGDLPRTGARPTRGAAGRSKPRLAATSDERVEGERSVVTETFQGGRLLARDPRAALRWRLLERVPLGVLFGIQNGWAHRRRVDYPGEPIYLLVRSQVEARELQACRREPWTVEWIEQWVRADEVVYDIGAGSGVFALVASGHGAQVVAIEPRHDHFAALCENIIANRRDRAVTPFPVALGAKTSLQTVRQPGPLGLADHRLADEPAGATLPTLTFRLDDLIERFGLPKPRHLRLAMAEGLPGIIAGACVTLGGAETRSVLVETSAGASRQVMTALAEFGLRPETGRGGGVTERVGSWHGLFRREGADPDASDLRQQRQAAWSGAAR
jgi:FkbM family methyltransferase